MIWPKLIPIDHRFVDFRLLLGGGLFYTRQLSLRAKMVHHRNRSYLDTTYALAAIALLTRGYSTPVDVKLGLEDKIPHLYLLANLAVMTRTAAKSHLGLWRLG